MRGTRRELLFGATALALAGCQTTPKAAPAAAPDGGNAKADAAARAMHAAAPTPALSVAVARTGGVVWAQAYGKVDIELDVATQVGHRFRLGSVSKVVTATAAAKLASRKVLDLGAPISTWMPDLPAPHRQTTLAQLLTHRGGVRHYIPRDTYSAAPGGPLDTRTYPTAKDILATFIDDPLVAQPGERVFYSTFGYTLASLVMEAAAKQPFTDLIRTEIAEPMGLASLEADDPLALRPMRVSGYGRSTDYRARYPLVAEGWANARQINPGYKWAGGGFVMTPSDIALFGAAHLDPVKITAEQRAMLFTPLTEAAPNSPPLGLGWRIDADATGRKRWHHAGNQEGARASLVVYPDLGLSIAFATNVAGTPGDVLTPSSQLADAFI